MMESKIEKAICNYVAVELGGIALKLELNNMRGWPDRTCLLPGGRIVFLEIKKPGGKLSQGQKQWLYDLERLGFEAYAVDSLDSVKTILERSET